MLKTVTVLLAGVASALALAPTATAAPPAPEVSRHVAHHAVHQQASRPHNPLLKDRLAEEEDEDEPSAPGIKAQCRKYVGKPNPYPATGSNVDMINGDNIVAAGSQAGCYTAQNETTIASNPNNPANIVSGANDYRVYSSREGGQDSSSYAYTSMDGGQTWTDVLIPGLTYSTGAVGALRAMDGAGDPIVAFGPNNTVYFGSIAFSRAAPGAGATEAPSAITVNVSHDGGLTFGKPHIVEVDGADSHGNFTATRVFNDKIWLAVDPSSGQLYVTWTRFLDTPQGGYAESPIVISTSTDGGATFSPYKRIDTKVGVNNPGLQPFSQGSNPRVGPDGTLYVAYESTYCQTGACDRPTDRDVTVVATSTDHGRTFARSLVGTNYDFPEDDQVGDSVAHRRALPAQQLPATDRRPDHRAGARDVGRRPQRALRLERRVRQDQRRQHRVLVGGRHHVDATGRGRQPAGRGLRRDRKLRRRGGGRVLHAALPGRHGLPGLRVLADHRGARPRGDRRRHAPDHDPLVRPARAVRRFRTGRLVVAGRVHR